MNKYVERLPKQYQFAVKDFYKDADGWWICLDTNGPYEFDGYASQYTIHEDTQLEAIRQFRSCVSCKKSERLYLAYGSNLNLAQMKNRCPGAKLLGYAMVNNYRLIFRGSGSGNYLSIEPEIGNTVPCGVFSITPKDERNLDNYEGFPRFYKKMELHTVLNCNDGSTKKICAMVYYLPKECQAGLPTSSYVRTCKQGYKDLGFDESALRQAMCNTWEEL